MRNPSKLQTRAWTTRMLSDFRMSLFRNRKNSVWKEDFLSFYGVLYSTANSYILWSTSKNLLTRVWYTLMMLSCRI